MSESTKEIIKAVLAIVGLGGFCVWVASNCDGTVTVNPDYNIDDMMDNVAVGKSNKAAITAIYQTSMKKSFDSGRVESAKDICRVAKMADDDTKSYAIEKLGMISAKCDFDHSKREIDKLIMEVVS